MLYGRDTERAELRAMVASARSGRSTARIVRGAAGIGKTALLDATVAEAPDFHLLRALGVESESELAFAGLSALLGRYSDRLDRLPDAQGRALSAALGLGSGGDHDRFLVGLGVLTLLAELAEEHPVLCVVDDAQWLDRSSAEALLFAARRVHAERIALVFAARRGHAPEFTAPGIDELQLAPLPEPAARQVLDDALGPASTYVRDRLLREADGNPLALRVLARGGSTATRSEPVRTSTERAIAAELAHLPERTRTLLLLVAVDATQDAGVVFAAGRALGADVHDLAPAERADLVRVTEGRVIPGHPLVRAAVLGAATTHDRARAHLTLANALHPEVDADRRAWHHAAAQNGPEESTARELERVAERSSARGGFAGVGAALERAAELSPDPERRGRRTLGAANALLHAGSLHQAEELGARAAALLPHPVDRARVAEIRATVAEEGGRPRAAFRTLVDAASAVAESDPHRADHLYFRAVDAAITACDVDAVTRITDGAPGGDRGGTAAAALARAATGFASDSDDALATAVASLRHLVEIPQPADAPSRDAPLRLSWLLLLGDDTGLLDLAEAQAQEQRARGAVGVLPWTLSGLARAQWNSGRVHEAVASATEGATLAAQTGQNLSASYLASIQTELAAVQGDGARGAAAIGPPGGDVTAVSRVLDACVSVLRDLGQGRHERALDHQAVLTDGNHRMFTFAALPDLVEAAARAGEPERAADAGHWFVRWAHHTASPWAVAVAARCQALLATSSEAERYFARAVDHHRTSGTRPFERARTELLYGEWLRRHRGRAAARPLLRSAADLFESVRAHPWARRSHAELRATGESRRHPTSVSTGLDRLTPQELQVVRLAAQGLSNREIGGHLFLSPRTVGYHLSNAYPKLQVASRRELVRLNLDS
ncbi:AAA family ATPase [Spiractinospora alimapuensis]|uniref:helix-turn-helix transcriptional regulator n=1 Tax=Spiractinospora alimapuensis TaxID=2820884 RepID=UPI001F374EBC|nr:helix-turn-helix transcriptional regulator [Spiractinospora alimapuensis]QVQ52336.1 AAA family ATPase [Spiractinospora alimapuensis]